MFWLKVVCLFGLCFGVWGGLGWLPNLLSFGLLGWVWLFRVWLFDLC